MLSIVAHLPRVPLGAEALIEAVQPEDHIGQSRNFGALDNVLVECERVLGFEDRYDLLELSGRRPEVGGLHVQGAWLPNVSLVVSAEGEAERKH